MPGRRKKEIQWWYRHNVIWVSYKENDAIDSIGDGAKRNEERECGGENVHETQLEVKIW